MKEHPVIGEKLCGDLRALHDVRPIVRHHHEHLDGSGYPDRLVGDDVPRLAQIIGIVDVYDAITTDRPYRAALSQAAAFTALRDEVGRGWRDGELVEVVHRDAGVDGSKLSKGEIDSPLEPEPDRRRAGEDLRDAVIVQPGRSAKHECVA